MSRFFHRFLLSLFFCVLWLGFGVDFGQAFKVPFRVKDVLPVLPRQITWPVLNNLHSAVDLLPAFVGSVSPNNGSVEWKGACFYGNEARLEFTESDRNVSGLGGGILHLTVRVFGLLITMTVVIIEVFFTVITVVDKLFTYFHVFNCLFIDDV